MSSTSIEKQWHSDWIVSPEETNSKEMTQTGQKCDRQR